MMPTREEIHKADDRITADARNYRFTFGTPTGQKVLSDLAAFCCADVTSITEYENGIDVYQTIRLEGRREVWLRIQRFMNLTPDQLFKIFYKTTVRELMPEEE